MYAFFLALAPVLTWADIVEPGEVRGDYSTITQAIALFLTILIEGGVFLEYRKFQRTEVTLPWLIGVNLMSHPIAWNLSQGLSRLSVDPRVAFYLVEILVVVVEAKILKSWKLSLILNACSAGLGLLIFN